MTFRRLRPRSLASLALLLVAALPLPALAQAGLQAPAQVAGLTQTSRQALGPGQGTSYLYQGGTALRPSIFIYPARPHGLQVTGGGAAGQKLGMLLEQQAQIRGFKESFPELARRGLFVNAVVQSDQPLVLQAGGRSFEGHRVVVSALQRGTAVSTSFYLFLVGNEFVKVRQTHPVGRLSVAQVDAFVAQLLAHLR